jgi:hypothetical protein
MKKIELIPLVGIQIEGIGQVDLGVSRADVQSVLGAPSDALDDQYYYDELERRKLHYSDERHSLCDHYYGQCLWSSLCA